MPGEPRVYFIGAGPGDAELITVKGARILCLCDLILYTGSLVPESVIQNPKEGARLLNTASMTLEEMYDHVYREVERGGLVGWLHTGDPSLYGTLREQSALLERDGIAYEVIPGVTAAMAAAARASVSFTLPEICQTLIITRLAGATTVPENESLTALCAHSTPLAIYLSAAHAQKVQETLLNAGLPPQTPILCAHRVGHKDEAIIWAPLQDLAQTVEQNHLQNQTVFLVLPKHTRNAPPSRLYSKDFSHSLRP